MDEFRKRFYDTELFFDRFAKDKFANYLFRAHGLELEAKQETYTVDLARERIEEAQLFIEAAYSCQGKMNIVSA